jgi:hypothetical protein
MFTRVFGSRSAIEVRKSLKRGPHRQSSAGAGTEARANGFSRSFLAHCGVEMKKVSAFTAFAVLVSLLASPAFGGEPRLNVKAICKSRETDARMLRSTPVQSTQDCMHDEEAAKTKLSSLWASTSASVRHRCVSDAHSLGTTSYLDLLTCIQMEEEMKSGAKKP